MDPAPSDARRPPAGPSSPVPWTTRIGRSLLLVAILLAPWPYGSVADVWRYPLTALVLFSSALVALRADLRPGLGIVLPLAAVPLVQILAGAAAPAPTLDAALSLWAPLAAWLVLRVPVGSRSSTTVAAAVAIGALLQAVFGLVQASVAPHSLYGRSTPWMTSSFGSFMNHNHFAGYAELGVLLCLGLCADRLRRDRDVSGRALLWGGAAALIGLAHLVSRSRGGLLGLGVGLLVFVLLRTGRLTLRRGAFAAAAVGAVLVAGLLALPPGARERVTAATTDGSAAYRLRLSAASVRLAAAHPLLGSGLGSFEDAVTVHKRGDGDVRSTHAENDVLEFVAETGLLGLGALAFAVWGLVATRGSSPLAEGALAAAVALGVHSLCDFNLRVPATALAFAAVLAVASPGRVRGVPAGRVKRVALPVVLGLLGLAATLASIAAVERARARPLADPSFGRRRTPGRCGSTPSRRPPGGTAPARSSRPRGGRSGRRAFRAPRTTIGSFSRSGPAGRRPGTSWPGWSWPGATRGRRDARSTAPARSTPAASPSPPRARRSSADSRRVRRPRPEPC